MENATEAYHIALSTAVGLTCVLSMFGSGAIIVSFIAFRELRTTMRYLLFNLSIADFIAAVTNLFGSIYSLISKRYRHESNDSICVTQATIGLIGTDASIIWTIVFIVYIYMFLVCCRPRRLVNYILLLVFTLFSWIFPIVLMMAFAFEGYLGYQSRYSPSFCTILSSKDKSMEIIGYGAFLYLAFLSLPIFSISFIVHLCYISRRNYLYSGMEPRYTTIIRATELKLILIPVFFLLTRVWGLVLDILIIIDDKEANKANEALVFLAGIGNSAQGFLNGVLFVLLTRNVRQRMVYGCCKVFQCCKREGNVDFNEEDVSVVSTFSYRGTESIQESGSITQDSVAGIFFSKPTISNPSLNSFGTDKDTSTYGSFDDKIISFEK